MAVLDFGLVAVSDKLWPLWIFLVAVSYKLGPLWIVAVAGCGCCGLWPLRVVAVMDCGRCACGRYDLIPCKYITHK